MAIEYDWNFRYEQVVPIAIRDTRGDGERVARLSEAVTAADQIAAVETFQVNGRAKPEIAQLRLIPRSGNGHRHACLKRISVGD